MLHISNLRHAMLPVALFMLVLVGCDQQQPIAHKPPPEPGFKQGETPPIEPEKAPARHHDGTIPLVPATAPTTPGEPNSPAAPAPLPPPPTSSPTEAPTLIPPAKDQGAVVPRPVTSPSDDQTDLLPSNDVPITTTHRDELINSAVYRALSSQPGLSSDGSVITVNTSEGVVTLRGSVTSDVERDQIAALAGQIAGVRSINNRLDVHGP